MADIDPDAYRRAFAVLETRGVDPELAVVLLPLYLNDHSVMEQMANDFVSSYERSNREDPTSDRYRADLADGVKRARAMVARNGLPQTPPEIAAELCPTEDAMHDELDKRTGTTTKYRTAKDGMAGGIKAGSATARRASRQISLSNATEDFENAPTRGVMVVRLCRDGKLRPDPRYNTFDV